MYSAMIRDWVRHAKFNVTQGKNWDATGSIGPWLVTRDEIPDPQNLALWLEVDGGVKVENIREIAEAGADTFVAGSAIFGTDDYAATIAAMRGRLAGRS